MQEPDDSSFRCFRESPALWSYLSAPYNIAESLDGVYERQLTESNNPRCRDSIGIPVSCRIRGKETPLDDYFVDAGDHWPGLDVRCRTIVFREISNAIVDPFNIRIDFLHGRK
jgi:hypothetical protein